MSTENEIVEPVEEGEAQVPYTNRFLEYFKEGLRDIAGREIRVEEQLFPEAIVEPVSPSKKDGPARYIVRWGREERTSKKSKKVKVVYTHERYFHVGQNIEELLPPYLKEELEETAERVQPYLAMGMDLAKDIPISAQASDEIRSAIVECADSAAVAENPDQFQILMQLRQAEVARMEATWRQAKMAYIRQFQDCAWHIFLSNVQMFFGCMLPIGIVTHPKGQTSGETELDINLEIMPLPMTQDRREQQSWFCTPDLRWQDTDFYMAVLPDCATESFYRMAARKVVGPSIDKSAPLHVGEAAAPVGMTKTASGLVVPE